MTTKDTNGFASKIASQAPIRNEEEATQAEPGEFNSEDPCVTGGGKKGLAGTAKVNNALPRVLYFVLTLLWASLE